MDEQILERTGEKPNLQLIANEIRQAQDDFGTYHSRMLHGWHSWRCRWEGQHDSGRKWAEGENKIEPWPGASDSRLRIVETIVRQFVSLSLYVFWKSKVSMKAVRPFVQGREKVNADRLLQWRVYTHMRSELLRELPLAFFYRFALGLSFVGIEWEQERISDKVPITLQDFLQIAQMQGVPEMADYLYLDEYENFVVQFLQSLSQIMSSDDARRIIKELRETGASSIPVVNLVVNRPSWRTLRNGIDLVYPSETIDIQKARFVSERELVSESELKDRVTTENYDPQFVDRALEHKGEFADFIVSNRIQSWPRGSDRDMIELHHFYWKSVNDGVPCMYRTVFNEAVLTDGKGGQQYALHEEFPYKHKQYPLVSMRWKQDHRKLLDSEGIAHEAYTDEIDIKTQQDGLNDRTALMIRPPFVIPPLREVLSEGFGPGKNLRFNRPNEMTWFPLPPSDGTPIEIIQMVKQRLDERYGIFGNEVDPTLKMIRNQELAAEIGGEIEMMLEQTWALQQQYETDEDVQKVLGKPGVRASTQDIQGRYELSVRIDMDMLNSEARDAKLDMYARALPFKQEGIIFQRIMELIDPDAADLIAQDQSSPEAMDREKRDEKSALAQMMNGIEPDFPQFGNHQLRLQTLQESLQKLQPNRLMQLQQNPDAMELIKNRVKQFTDNIQQRTENAQIGRTLAPSAFDRSKAASVETTQPQ